MRYNDFIETIEARELDLSEVAQCTLYSGEARHESWRAHAHEEFPERRRAGGSCHAKVGQGRRGRMPEKQPSARRRLLRRRRFAKPQRVLPRTRSSARSTGSSQESKFQQFKLRGKIVDVPQTQFIDREMVIPVVQQKPSANGSDNLEDLEDSTSAAPGQGGS